MPNNNSINDEIKTYIKHCDLNTIVLRLSQGKYIKDNRLFKCPCSYDNDNYDNSNDSNYSDSNDSYDSYDSNDSNDSYDRNCHCQRLEISELFIFAIKCNRLDVINYFLKMGVKIEL